MWSNFSTKLLCQAGYILAGLVLLVLGLVSAQAEEVSGLYETEVSVMSQNPDERKAALTAAMRQVLLRISGRSIVLTITGIEEALTQPTHYVQQYRYRTKEADVRIAATEVEQILWVRFDEKAINKLLRDNRMPVWGKTRPSVLLWMVVDDRKNRILMGNNVRHPASDLMLEQARLRGVPLHLPMLDLADSANLSTADVWGNFEDTILRASRRYQTEAILVGRVYQSYSGSWNVRWSLYNGGRQENWDARAESLVEVLIPGIDNTANTLAQQFTQVDTEEEQGSVLVQVYGIKNLASYNKTIEYLSSLSAVTDVQAFSVFRDNVIYRLQSRTGRLAISQSIALGHTLITSNKVAAPQINNRGNMANPGNETTKPALKQVTADLVYQLIQ